MSYSVKEKILIMNVFKYFSQEYPELRVTEIVRRTARATGCSEKSIFQFRKEEDTGFKEPTKTKVRKHININSREIKYDEEVRKTIREIITNLKDTKVVPSLNKILVHLVKRDDMPKFSLMTLRRLLYDMGYSYVKNGNKYTLTEQNRDYQAVREDVSINRVEVKSEVATNNYQSQPYPQNYATPIPGNVPHSWWGPPVSGYHYPPPQIYPS